MTQPLVVLEDEVINVLMRDPELCAAVPILANPPKVAAAGGCNTCTGNSNLIDYNAIKFALAYIPQAPLRRIKTLVNATRIRVYYRVAGARGITKSTR